MLIRVPKYEEYYKDVINKLCKYEIDLLSSIKSIADFKIDQYKTQTGNDICYEDFLEINKKDRGRSVYPFT
jgi:hypothetical protein